MTLRDLEYLVAVYDLRHFTRAAERCHVSQPTLSGQLQKLEDALGVPLIERSTRKVVFTRTGEAIAEQARRVLQEAARVRELARAAADPLSGEMHLGLIPTVGPYLLPRIMQQLHRDLPGLEFFLYELKTEDVLAKMSAGELDCAILALLDGMQDWSRLELYREDLLLAAPRGHELLDAGTLVLSDLDGEQVLMLEDGHCLRDQALGVCFEAGADEDPHFQATSLDTLRYMVGSGSGITLMPRLAALEHAGDEVVFREFEAPGPSRDIVLLFRESSPRIQAYEEIARSIRGSIAAA